MKDRDLLCLSVARQRPLFLRLYWMSCPSSHGLNLGQPWGQSLCDKSSGCALHLHSVLPIHSDPMPPILPSAQSPAPQGSDPLLPTHPISGAPATTVSGQLNLLRSS